MGKYTKEDILRIAEEEDVSFIRLQFTDVYGNLKNMAITAGDLEKALNNEYMFESSSVEGYDNGEEAQMYLYPDPDTWTIFPWRPQHGKVARMICDVYTADRKPFEGDSRLMLKKAIKAAEEMGYTFVVMPECEFFLFQTDENGQPTTQTNERAGYFDLGPIDNGENARRDMVLTLEEMGFEVEGSYHEKAPAQHEIDFKYDEALKTADNIVTFKLAVKTIARRHGQHATFMPKPKYGVSGSGMHLNMALFKDGVNLFTAKDGADGLSEEAEYFIGGLLKHIRAMTAVMNPLVNSYKRLTPGYDAPVKSGWSRHNRNTLIHIPDGECRKIELKSPDSAANPYLALAVALQAGLDGIRNKIKAPAALEVGQTNDTEVELPTNLREAVTELERDALVCAALGETIAPLYIKAKKNEWMEYDRMVSEWEVERYLYKY